MKKLLTIFALITLLITPVMAVAQVSAYDPFGGVDCSGSATTSVVCNTDKQTTDPIGGSNGLIMRVVKLVALIAGMAAVLIIIVSGLRMVTSNGGDGAAGARKALIAAAVGLVIIVVSTSLVAFVISKLS